MVACAAGAVLLLTCAPADGGVCGRAVRPSIILKERRVSRG